MSKFKCGDVVQLNSGGAPLTLNFKYLDKDWVALGMSKGGLMSEVLVNEDAIHLTQMVTPPPQGYRYA